MISYESSKWYIKMWRLRWYLYAILLHMKNIINIEFLLEYLLELEDNTNKRLVRASWREVKRHIELSKMHKYSSEKIHYERED